MTSVRTRLARLAVVSLVLLITGAAAAQSNEEQFTQLVRSLHWITSGTHSMSRVSEVDIPEGYLFLGPEDTAKLMKAYGNPINAIDNYYYFGPADDSWFAVFSYDPSGHVSDDEKVDPDAVLTSIREGTAKSNEERRKNGWPELTIMGWRFEPYYDPQTRRLEWATDVRSNDKQLVNFNTRILGREGVTSVTLVTEPSHLDADLPAFKRALTHFHYVKGERYTEFKQGDKVAEYGLAALITGGAAAAAVKSGALKGLWKILVLGAAAVLAGIKKLFGRKS